MRRDEHQLKLPFPEEREVEMTDTEWEELKALIQIFNCLNNPRKAFDQFIRRVRRKEERHGL